MNNPPRLWPLVDTCASTSYNSPTVKTPTTPATYPAHIVHFPDGDTVVMLIELGFGVKIEKPVRLQGIDSWEVSGPDEALALNARRILNDTFRGNAVTLVATSRGLDRYGRIRGDVRLNGKMLTEYIVANNFGWPANRRRPASANVPPSRRVEVTYPANPPEPTEPAKTSLHVARHATISEASQ